MVFGIEPATDIRPPLGPELLSMDYSAKWGCSSCIFAGAKASSVLLEGRFCFLISLDITGSYLDINLVCPCYPPWSSCCYWVYCCMVVNGESIVPLLLLLTLLLQLLVLSSYMKADSPYLDWIYWCSASWALRSFSWSTLWCCWEDFSS